METSSISWRPLSLSSRCSCAQAADRAQMGSRRLSWLRNQRVVRSLVDPLERRQDQRPGRGCQPKKQSEIFSTTTVTLRQQVGLKIPGLSRFVVCKKLHSRSLLTTKRDVFTPCVYRLS